MPTTVFGVLKRAERECWQGRPRQGHRGGGREFPLSCLPEVARAALFERIVEAAPPLSVPATGTDVAVIEPAALADWQRETATARKALVDEAQRIGAAIGVDRAIRNLVRLAAASELPEHLQRLVPVANQKSGKEGKRTLSRRSLYRWIALAEQSFVALAPAAPRTAPIPAWAPALIKLWQQPQQHSLAFHLEQLAQYLPPGVQPPSYDAARRFMTKLGNVEKMRGRMGPRELKSIRPYVKRDTSHMWPGDCYTADGHTFDAEIAHPAHGRPFRPEITTVLDVATRRAVGWSAGLNESTWAVLDAQRNAIETGGVCSLWYVDNGGGYRNAMQSNDVVGFAARLGITITHSLPYNSQARGLMERSHKTIWVAAAQALPTYMGALMDREARHNVFKLTRRDIKAVGTSRLLMPWREFLTYCQEQIDGYNNKPHRGLPKLRDQVSGRMRHMSPNEAWQQAINEGWHPVMVEPAEAADMFRPYKLCKTARGMVQLFNNSYFSAALEEFHGDQVQVGYDIHDASRVWVRDGAGRLICVAEFEANRKAYFPQTVIDQAAEKRAAGRIRRAEVRIEEAQAELRPPQLIDQSTGADLVPLVIEPELEKVPVLLQREDRRPMFDTDPEKYRWLQMSGTELTLDDERWIAEYKRTSEYRDLFGDSDEGNGGEDFLEAAAR